MSMTSAAERAQHEDAAAQCVRAFLAVVPPVRLHLTDEARSDQATVAHAAAPNNKRAHGGNYLHRYLAWRADPRSAEQLAAFLSAKLEPERFLQWAGARRQCASLRAYASGAPLQMQADEITRAASCRARRHDDCAAHARSDTTRGHAADL